jgi:O-antigen/teichoic acid export membrane protein/tRNA A-37 threonylcarbamoyl transferase component Bud32
MPGPIALASATAVPGARHTVVGRRLRTAITAPHVISLADQAVVSGASFLMTLIVGRLSSPTELGLYAVGTSILMSVAGIQASLISLPYAVDRSRTRQNEAERLGGALALSVLLSTLVAATLVLFAAVLARRGLATASVVGALAVIVPFTQLREFARQHAFAHLLVGRALRLDAAVAIIQFAALACLAWLIPMRATTALLAICVGCGSIGILWMVLRRHSIATTQVTLANSARRSWIMGRWLCATEITVSVQVYSAFWLLAWLLGPAAAGIYTACMTVAVLANPMVVGLGNILAPRTVHAFAADGTAGVRRQVTVDAALLGAAVGGVCLIILLFGDQLIALAFRGVATYRGHTATMLVLAFGLLASAVGMPASNALAGLEYPRPIFWAGLAGAAVSVVLSSVLAVRWGIQGAAYGFAAGHLTGAAARWLVLLTITRRMDRESHARADVAAVLHQSPFAAGIQSVTRLGEGEEAVTYHVAFASTDTNCVVKLFKTNQLQNADLARDQSHLLLQLRAALDGLRIAAWTVSVPEPLFVSHAPPALVMTVVHGKPLEDHLHARAQLSRETSLALARTVVTAMDPAWSRGVVHGDFNLENILCDSQNRRLAFLDPGRPFAACISCGSDERRWAAVDDLGHLLFEEATKVRRLIRHPISMLRRRQFVTELLRAQLDGIEGTDDKRAFVADIRNCSRRHLELLLPSWSPRGIWLWLLRSIAAIRIDRMAAGLMHQTQ